MSSAYSYKQSLAYLLGKNVPKDERRAFEFNTEAARGGHADAVLAMGWFYLNGVGVAHDVAKAKKWYRESARRGEKRAIFSLGQTAYGERDFSEAHYWFSLAVGSGHHRSLYWLGKLHWRGEGVARDRKVAMRFFQRAASNKIKEAQRVLRFLGRNKRMESHQLRFNLIRA